MLSLWAQRRVSLQRAPCRCNLGTANPDGTAFRFNNHDNPYLSRDALLKLIHAENLPYQTLISE